MSLFFSTVSIRRYGNHDISQESLKPMLLVQKGTLAEMADEELFNDNLSSFTPTFLAPKFANYLKFESQFAKYSCCSTSLGGQGWHLSDEIGVYCLNSALCSYADLKDASGAKISDEQKLMVDMRSLHSWLSKSNFKIRILVMHHPLDWLAAWSKAELEKIVDESFHLVFAGHIHQSSSALISKGFGNSVRLIASPLFTRMRAVDQIRTIVRFHQLEAEYWASLPRAARSKTRTLPWAITCRPYQGFQLGLRR